MRRSAPSAAAGSSPWTVEDLLRLASTLVVGVAVATVAWHQAGGEHSLPRQVRWANLSVGGFAIVSYGIVVWLLRGRRAVGERMLHLLGEAPSSVVLAVPSVSPAASGFVGGADRRLYHRPGCALARGRGWTATDRGEHERAGRRPCGVCGP